MRGALLCLAPLAATAWAQVPGDWLLSNFAARLEMRVSNPASTPVQALAVVPVHEVAQAALGFPGSLAIAVALDPTEVLPSQADDLDGDGIPDEFLFPIALGPGGSRAVHIYYSTTLRDSIPYPKRVHASHAYGYNHATAALESEEIGYRTYGGFFLDVQARWEGRPGLYNSLVGYFGTRATPLVGEDIIHLGDTLGLGGIFLRRRDQLYRPPLNMPDYAHKPAPLEAPDYRVIADGPLRAMIEARMDRWKIGADEVAVRARYSIAAGTPEVECQVDIVPLHMNAASEYEVGAGIRHLPKLQLHSGPGRLALSGAQNANTGPLALALFYDPAEAVAAEPLATPEDRNECVVFRQKLKAGQAVRVRYHVAAAWSGSGIPDLFAHLDRIERQARAQVRVGGFRLARTPEPQRVEGEAR